MEKIFVDREITLVPWYPNPRAALKWYQDEELCRQVDNRDGVYDLPLLRGMYRYLHSHGALYYIKYRGRLCGDICLQDSGEINIVVAREYQNRRIGRRAAAAMVELARKRGMERCTAEIYSFNAQSRRMFEALGFREESGQRFVLPLKPEQEAAP